MAQYTAYASQTPSSYNAPNQGFSPFVFAANQLAGYINALKADPMAKNPLTGNYRAGGGSPAGSWDKHTDPNKIKASYAVDAKKGLLAQIQQDYANLGGLSPETRAAVDALKTHVGGGKPDIDQAMNAQIKDFAAGMGTVAGFGPDTKVKFAAAQPGTNAEGLLSSYLANESLDYLDPTTKAEMRQQLYRSNPMLFRAYGMAPPAGSVPPAAVPGTPPPSFNAAAQAAQLNQFVSALDFNKLNQQLGKFGGVNNTGVGVSNVNWLKNYLTTAATGLGGTKAQQQLSAQSLAGLENEAQANKMGDYLNIAKSLVNPAGQSASSSNIIGQEKAFKPLGANYKRAGMVYRNLGAL